MVERKETKFQSFGRCCNRKRERRLAMREDFNALLTNICVGVNIEGRCWILVSLPNIVIRKGGVLILREDLILLLVDDVFIVLDSGQIKDYIFDLREDVKPTL